MGTHRYTTTVRWTGNTGTGTSSYRDYARAYTIVAAGKAPIAGSSEPLYRGDATRWNPEELLVASLSACHQLWYLHLCADAGIVVTAYEDTAGGTMVDDATGAGSFTQVTLRPHATLAAGSDPALAIALHDVAAEKCAIARSMNFPVSCEPAVSVADDDGALE
jgi:organic hydroperoxide reductase OsmC/OhrA